MYTNADQYLNKRNEMKALIALNQPDVIGITEIKPKVPRYKVEESEIVIEGYEVFHNLDMEGRGIALLVKTEMKPTPCDSLKSSFNEHLFVECIQDDGTVITFCLVYRSSSCSQENNHKLCELIRKTSEIYKNDILFIGDFNLPSIDLKTETCNKSKNHVAAQFLERWDSTNTKEKQLDLEKGKSQTS